MEAGKFFRGADNHLGRAEGLFAQGKQKPEPYVFCALELRFGIESRLREYLQHQEHVAEKKKRGWQIAALGRDVEQAFSGCVQEVRIDVWSGGFPMIRCKYTPVTPELRAIGERLGNYLHAPKNEDLREMAQWEDFELMLQQGLSLLRYACSGNLLGVPLVESGANQGRLNLSVLPEQNAVMKELFKRKAEFLMKVSYCDPAGV